VFAPKYAELTHRKHRNHTFGAVKPTLQRNVNWTNISQITTALQAIEYDIVFDALMANKNDYQNPDAWWTSPTPSSSSYRHHSNGRSLKLADSPSSGWPVDWSQYIARIQYGSNEYTCDLYDIAKESISTAVGTTLEYYENGFKNRENLSLSLRDNLMRSVPVNYSQETVRQRAEFLKSSQTGVPQGGFIDVGMDWAKMAITTVTLSRAIATLRVCDGNRLIA
jgi:hypothetical protein